MHTVQCTIYKNKTRVLHSFGYSPYLVRILIIMTDTHFSSFITWRLITALHLEILNDTHYAHFQLFLLLCPARGALHDSQLKNNPYLSHTGLQCSCSVHPLSKINFLPVPLSQISFQFFWLAASKEQKVWPADGQGFWAHSQSCAPEMTVVGTSHWRHQSQESQKKPVWNRAFGEEWSLCLWLTGITCTYTHYLKTLAIFNMSIYYCTSSNMTDLKGKHNMLPWLDAVLCSLERCK